MMGLLIYEQGWSQISMISTELMIIKILFGTILTEGATIEIDNNLVRRLIVEPII